MLDLRQGDSNKLLDSLPENSVDSIVTDAPYGLSFMGKKWDYDVPSVEFWRKCLRVLKPGGTALIFAGSRTQHVMATRVEEAGFLLKDTMMWMYGSGFPKAMDISKAIDKSKGVEREVVGQRKGQGSIPNDKGGEWGLQPNTPVDVTIPATEEAKLWDGWKSHALKPAYEPILVAMKPNEENYVTNAEKWGVAGLNIDDCRIPIGDEQVPRMNIPYERKSDNNFGGGEDKRQGTITGHESTGRFPTNVILNHTPNCKMLSTLVKVKGQQGGDRTKTFGDEGEAISGGEGSGGAMKNPDGYVNKWECSDDCPCKMLDDQTKGKIGQGHWSHTKVTGFGDTYEYSGPGEKDTEKEKGASRFFYCAKASSDERNIGLDELDKESAPKQGSEKRLTVGGAKDVALPRANVHPTVKPIELMEYLCKLTKTPNGGVVLDPFMGSGSTGIACLLTQRDFIGFELDEKYFNIAELRINNFNERKWRGLFVEEEDQSGLDKWF